jgi:hypothetical protein
MIAQRIGTPPLWPALAWGVRPDGPHAAPILVSEEIRQDSGSVGRIEGSSLAADAAGMAREARTAQADQVGHLQARRKGGPTRHRRGVRPGDRDGKAAAEFKVPAKREMATRR